MTEAEWFACADPKPMLRSLPHGISERKLRLFACACCRRIWDLIKKPGYRAAVEWGEQHADGQMTALKMMLANQALRGQMVAIDFDFAVIAVLQAAEITSKSYRECAIEAASRASSAVVERHRDDQEPNLIQSLLLHKDQRSFEERLRAWQAYRQEAVSAEEQGQACLVRDIFGNPLRSACASPYLLAWNDGTVVKIAQAIYTERRFEDMPILADALEDAGCDNGDILAHWRQPGEHVRGCWVVDLLLGKE